MGRARSDCPNEVVYQAFAKMHFHCLTDAAFMWLSKRSWKEKPSIVLIRKSDPLGRTPGGTFRFEEQCHRRKSCCESRMMRRDILEKCVKMHNL